MYSEQSRFLVLMVFWWVFFIYILFYFNFEDILNYILGLVCLHKVIFVAIFSVIFLDCCDVIILLYVSEQSITVYI